MLKISFEYCFPIAHSHKTEIHFAVILELSILIQDRFGMSEHREGSVIQGERLTKGCKRVLEVLERTKELSSAQDIHGQLRAEEASAPGLTTVYRSLESLVTLGLVQAVDLGDGERRYELIEPGEHHHHIICDNCRSSIHLDQCLVEELEKAIAVKYGYEIRSHILEIFGKCPACKARKSE
jgi:Fur family ferric uptake transcriptional regulator